MRKSLWLLERVKGIEPSFRVWWLKMVWFRFPLVLYIFAVKHVMNTLFWALQKQW